MQQTVRTLSSELGILPSSLKRKIDRKGFGKFSFDEKLPEFVIGVIQGEEKPQSDVVVPVLEDRPAQRTKRAKNKVKKIKLQEHLSSDWLIIAVLIVILFADMTAFAIIAQNRFSDSIWFAPFMFAMIGLATGLGAVVTYNRIEDGKLAERWKIAFGVLQFLVFSLAINESWFFAELTMTSMFVLVFIGVQRSIKK